MDGNHHPPDAVRQGMRKIANVYFEGRTMKITAIESGKLL